MSRRSHHPARRHVRAHGDVRPPRAAGPADGPPATGAGPGNGPRHVTGPSNGGGTIPARPKTIPAPPAMRAQTSQAEASPRRLNGHDQTTESTGASAPLASAGMPDAPSTEPLEDAPPAQPVTQAAPVARPSQSARPHAEAGDLERNGCTAPQLRRFIKSRAYVPMHELRRRFAIEGDDDEVTPVDMAAGSRIFVGLPGREGRLLGELLRTGDIGYELSMDPISPIVVGVFPMRPVPRA